MGLVYHLPIHIDIGNRRSLLINNNNSLDRSGHVTIKI